MMWFRNPTSPRVPGAEKQAHNLCDLLMPGLMQTVDKYRRYHQDAATRQRFEDGAHLVVSLIGDIWMENSCWAIPLLRKGEDWRKAVPDIKSRMFYFCDPPPWTAPREELWR